MAPTTNHSVHPENTRDARRQRNPVNEIFYGSEHWSFDSLLIHREMSNVAWRAFWIMATIGCVALFVFMSVLNFMTYARWEIIVTTAIKEPAMNFPTVTFCNLNPYKRKGLDTLKKKMTMAPPATTALISETSPLAAGSEETKKSRTKRAVTLCQDMGSFCYIALPSACSSHDEARMACAGNGDIASGGRLAEFDNFNGSDFAKFFKAVTGSTLPRPFYFALGYYYSSSKASFVKMSTGEPVTVPDGVNGSDGYSIFYEAKAKTFISAPSGQTIGLVRAWCQVLQVDDGHTLEVPCAKLHRFCHGDELLGPNKSSPVNHFYTTNPEDPDRMGFNETPVTACEKGWDETTAMLPNVYMATIALPSPSATPWFTPLTEMVNTDNRFAYITDSTGTRTKELIKAGYVANRIVGYMIAVKPGNTIETMAVTRWNTYGTGSPIVNNSYPADVWLMTDSSTSSNVSEISPYAPTYDSLMVFIHESNGMCSLGRGVTTTSTTSTTSTSTTTTSTTTTTTTPTTTTSTTSTSTTTTTPTPTTTTVTTTPASTSKLSTSSASSTVAPTTSALTTTSTSTPMASTSTPAASTSSSTTRSSSTSTSTSYASSTASLLTTPSTSISIRTSTSAPISTTPITSSRLTTTASPSSSNSVSPSTSLIPTKTTTSSTRAISSTTTSTSPMILPTLPTSLFTIAILPFTAALNTSSSKTSSRSPTSAHTSGAISSSKPSSTSSTSSSSSTPSSTPSTSHTTSTSTSALHLHSSTPHLTSNAISSTFVSTSTHTSPSSTTSSAVTTSSVSSSSSSSTSSTSTSTSRSSLTSTSSSSTRAIQSSSSPRTSSPRSDTTLSTSTVDSLTTSSTSLPIFTTKTTVIPVITTKQTSIASPSSTSTLPSSITSALTTTSSAESSAPTSKITSTSMEFLAPTSSVYSSTSTEFLESSSPMTTSTFGRTASSAAFFTSTTAFTTLTTLLPTSTSHESTSPLIVSSPWSTVTSTLATSTPQTPTSTHSSTGSTARSTLATTAQSLSSTAFETTTTAYEPTTTFTPTETSTTVALTTSALTSTPESSSSSSTISPSSSAAALSASSSTADASTASAESTSPETLSTKLLEASSSFTSRAVLTTENSLTPVAPTVESETTGAHWTTSEIPTTSHTHNISSTTFTAAQTSSTDGTTTSSTTSITTTLAISTFVSESSTRSTSTDLSGTQSTTFLSSASTAELIIPMSTFAPVQRGLLPTRSPGALQSSISYDATPSDFVSTWTTATSSDQIPRGSSTAAQIPSAPDDTTSYRRPEQTESSSTTSTISQETFTIAHSPVSQLSTEDMSTVSDTSAATFSTTSSSESRTTEQESTPSSDHWSIRSSSQEQSEISERGNTENSAITPSAALSDEEENDNDWEKYVKALATVAETPLSDFKDSFQSHDDLASVTGVEASLPFILGRLSDEEIEEMDLGYTLADLVLMCTFASKNCTNDLRLWRSPVRGNCVSFNHYLDPEQIQYKMGEKGGLRIYFKTNRDTYLPSTISSGMQVIISDRGMPIMPSIEDTIAAPDMIASFAVTYVERTKISHCNEDITDETGHQEKNSREACLQTCFQDVANKFYNCIDPSLDFNLPNATYCNLTQKSYIDALHDLRWSDSNCTCAVACSTNDFSYIQTNYRVRTGGPSVVKSLFKDGDMGIIEVYQYTNIYVSYVENWYFSSSDLLSTLANDFGLYTGCSLMTFAEFAIVIYLTYHKVSKYVVR